MHTFVIIAHNVQQQNVTQVHAVGVFHYTPILFIIAIHCFCFSKLVRLFKTSEQTAALLFILTMIIISRDRRSCHKNDVIQIINHIMYGLSTTAQFSFFKQYFK